MAIELAGRPIDSDASNITLASVDVHSSVYAPASATVIWRDRHFEIPDIAEIGKEVLIRANSSAGAQAVIFTGVVVAMSVDIGPRGRFTTLRAMNRSYALLTTPRVASFTKSTVEDMAKKVAQRSGLSLKEAPKDTTRYDHFSQASVTDWEFLQKLGRLTGTVVKIAGKEICMSPLRSVQGGEADVTIDATKGRDGIAISIDAVGQTGSVELRAWNAEKKKEITVVEKKHSAASEHVELGSGITPAKAAALLQVEDPFLAAEGCTTEDRAIKDSEDLGRQQASRFLALEATVPLNPTLVGGSVVEVTKAGAYFSGRYTATGVRHLFDSADARCVTTISVTSLPRTSAASTGSGQAAGRVGGVAIALVEDVKADHPDTGMVRLRFPWLSPDYVSGWVRTLQLSGGGVFLPDVNDEVLVSFEQGSLEHPVVLGRLFNGGDDENDKPVAHEGPLWHKDTGHVNRRSIASPAGDVMEFLDEEGAIEGIRLRTKDSKAEVFLDRNENVISFTCTDGTITLDAQKIVMTATDGIDLSAAALKLTADGGEIEALAESVTIDGSASVHIN
ncbi:VgrG-related protein [Streptomyces sp. H27-H5]|uniref:VgrG-related protein n=1 Tax=Streptomyces sp. H27-H5 TaxID=2996460 RepID=UPI00227046C6|nr:VgrG-related protein [Streptomyces sp. H27-H5]MCY0962360.1 VgrG-related protein [Streptomyces sp. H27-H5]